MIDDHLRFLEEAEHGPMQPVPVEEDYHGESGLQNLADALADKLRGQLPSETPQVPAPMPPRLTVDLARMTITLDGQTYDVPSENALRWVKVLADHTLTTLTQQTQ